ncbi:hypothetical protein E4U42_005847 [Claviceps africana]|uniref:Uncharacterized protein n=1 Tax=Claviceps africana TaxID=83212 RepID=A0A8K0J3Q0_9HYPO|nr:hypothetical protein E4U42_005847 [Claviceps africana]
MSPPGVTELLHVLMQIPPIISNTPYGVQSLELRVCVATPPEPTSNVSIRSPRRASAVPPNSCRVIIHSAATDESTTRIRARE